jgi:hypothetical protein
MLNLQSSETLSLEISLDSVSRPELASNGPEIEYQVQLFILC